MTRNTGAGDPIGLDWRLALVLIVSTVLALSALGHGILESGDEARFALAARSILNGGPWLVPTVLGEPLVIKPPLFIWLITLAAKWHGQLDEFAARLPGALSAVAAAVTAYLLGARLFSRQVGLLAALFLSTTLGVFVLSREVLPDMAMTATSAAAVLSAVAAAQGGSRWAVVGFAAALALAFHFKLLAGLLPPLATVFLVAALRRDLQPIRALRPALGVLVFLMVLLPWFAQGVVVPDFVSLIDSETFRGRAWQSWSRLVTSPVAVVHAFLDTVSPWSLLLPAAAAYVWSRRRKLRDDPVLVPLVWLAVVFALTMSVDSVRWRYTLPALPPAVLILAQAWQTGIDRGRLGRWLSLGPLAAMLAAFSLMGILTLARIDPTRRLDGNGLLGALQTLPWMLVPAAWIVAGAAGLSVLKRRPRRAMLLCVALVGLSLATLEPLTRDRRDGSSNARTFATQVRAVAARRTILVSYWSLRLHFYLDGPVALLREPEIPAALADPARKLILMGAETLEALIRKGVAPRTVAVLADGRFADDHVVLVQAGGE